MRYIPYHYQDFAYDHIIDNSFSGLFIDMGLGKTVITLTAISNVLLMENIDKVLVIAPLAVAKDTWEDEINKWEHLRHLTVSKVIGTEKERLAALQVEADIYTINCENVAWLFAAGRHMRFNYLVVDESSKFKDQSSKRFKALRAMLPKFRRITILTGTPRPNSLMDLWSQLYILDRGERLGDTITGYRQKYFNAIPKQNYVKYDVKVNENKSIGAANRYEKIVYKKISDICISMKAKDYVDLPERIDNIVKISLPEPIMEKYRQFEEELVMEIMDKEVTAANAAVLTGKLLQFSNGAIYDDERAWHKVHDEKLNALEDIIDVANGPVLVMYQFQHDYERICKRFKKKFPKLKTSAERKAWNEGKIPIAVAHAKSIGHGLNLQGSGNIIVWFGVPWSLELYDQANARLIRLGSAFKSVTIHHILCKATADIKTLTALRRKAAGQDGCMEFVKARMAHYKQLKLAA
ncbi:MAG TPA: DEAD/DEAH box helicase [Flavobacterium sp.]|nr:DEAD/DEAH box helicase [Flavobacterium sp.]